MKLIEIDNYSNEDIDILYNFLRNRKYSISHKKLPSYEEHKMFVRENPYRKWFFINHQSKLIGSMYILKDNGIGIDIKSEDYILLGEIIKLLHSSISPLPALPSVRVGNFHMNISPQNEEVEKQLRNLGAVFKQKTYEFIF